MNWTLAGQTWIANTLTQIYGTTELLAVIALVILAVMLVYGGVSGGAIFAVMLFAGLLMVSPAIYGGFELFPIGNIYFNLILIIGGIIIGLAIWRMFRNV